MFQLWLDKQPEASWEQLIKALKDIDLNTTELEQLSINEGEFIC